MMKKHHQRYFQQFGIKEENIKLHSHNPEAFEKWKNGETGNNFINANMIELKRTGFMSNRGRQNVASFLHHDLQTDWRYGAAYFEEQLIDYDVCSNWGNWAYLAGVGNDPRGNRKFDTEKQAKQYDTTMEYRQLWLKK
jgi:deoxyribodipyrimidine photo-lyase